MLRCHVPNRQSMPWLLLPLALAAASFADGLDGPLVVHVRAADRAQVDDLGRFLDIWHVDPTDWTVTAVARPGDLRALRRQGLRPEVDGRLGKRLLGPSPVAPELGGIPGFPCYRTVDGTLASLRRLAADYPHLATLVDIGDSWEKVHGIGGRDLLLLRLAGGAEGGTTTPRPALMVIGGTHAREYTPVELVTRFAERLLAAYGSDPDVTWLLDHHSVHLLPLANPDGRLRAQAGLSWRKNANDDHCGGSDNRGVDLNRNYPFQWGCCGGSSASACSPIFRGPALGSEPEAAAIMAYARSIFPDQRGPALDDPAPEDATGILIDVHSYGEDVLWSWGFTTQQPPNGPALYTLGRKLAWWNGYRPQHGSLSTVDGPTKDFAYGELGVAGFTYELGNAFFESCAAFEGAILEDNLGSLLYAAKASRAPYALPGGPDVADLRLDGEVAGLALVGDAVALTARVDDTRFSQANGVEPTQAVAAAEARVGVPPHLPGPPALALDAADGTFDTGVEAVSGVLDTSFLGAGRHLLFVRGRDADGRWGPPGAAFLYLADPLASPVLSGRVADARTGSPVLATVEVGNLRRATDADGRFHLRLPAGVYDLRIRAAGYGTRELPGLAMADGQTLVRHVNLLPFDDLLVDDVEQGPGGFQAQPPWAISNEASHSPDHAWSDSPVGAYANGADVSLTSPAVDLSGLGAAVLTFWQRLDLEDGFDFAVVEGSADGILWTPLASFTGTADWSPREVALAPLDGVATARLRFRLLADPFTTGDGWHLDDLRLRALPAGARDLIFLDGFEDGGLGSWSTVQAGATR